MADLQKQPHMAVLGGGAWGTALACVLAQQHGAVTLWANEAETVNAINEARENPQFLPDITLPDAIHATENLADLSDANIILMVVPAQFARPVLTALAAHNKHASLVLCSKGIERGSLKLMSDVAGEIWPHGQLAVLSGPSFAADVARGLPTAVTLACADATQGAYLADHIGTAHFRPYLSDDIIGAEIGGAIKNVLAIACGIVAGKNLGESALAAVTARGFAEMNRLGEALGGKAETFAGLAGMGDMIATCTSPQSRNRHVGMELAKGRSIDDIIDTMHMVAEGVKSAPTVIDLAQEKGISLPISEDVYRVIIGESSARGVYRGLLRVTAGAESDPG